MLQKAYFVISFLISTAVCQIYSNNRLGDVKEGVSFTITARNLTNSDSLIINFFKEFPKRQVALNIKPYLRITSCSEATVLVTITKAGFVIAINGRHFECTPHRVPPEDLTLVEITGFSDNIDFKRNDPPKIPPGIDDEDLVAKASVDLVRVNNYAAVAPNDWNVFVLNRKDTKMPYYGVLPPNSFERGKTIRIEGAMIQKAKSFTVNLQDGLLPSPDIAFHFNPRLKTLQIVMNSNNDSKWMKEKIVELNNKFYPLLMFSLRIVCGASSYEVFLNDESITDYSFQLDTRVVNTVHIHGDIRLFDVVLEDHGTNNDDSNELCDLTFPVSNNKCF